MNITRGKRKRTEAGRTDDAENVTPGRRGVLAGLAAIPVLYSLGGAATPASAAPAAQPDSIPTATGELVRGEEQRYHAPLLAPGTRLVLPAGVKAVPVHDYYSGPYVASAQSAWPHLTATDGTTVDASIVPERGAPTRIAMLSGFTEGWYELSHASGRIDRVTWNARKLPVLWFYGEFGATDEVPYRDWFYTLALQPFSRNPYSRNTPAK